MIVIKCKNNSDLNRAYHLMKAFFPNQEIKQQINTEQEPQLEFILDDGSCFTVLPEEASEDEEKGTLVKKVYDVLSEYTNKTLPWGILTGVRPTKLAMKAIMEGTREKDRGVEGDDEDRKESIITREDRESQISREEIEKILCEKYYLSGEKAKLAVEVAKREKELLATLDLENDFSLYVSIPFCPSICSYCSFGSGELEKWQDKVDEYLDRLCDEITAVGDIIDERIERKSEERKSEERKSEERRKEFGEINSDEKKTLRKLNTIYIGGGTPTTLNTEQFEKLFNTIKKTFSLDHLIEYTVEAGRPETITREKLRLFKGTGVTRISINPQSMNQKTLDRVGRNHKVSDIVEAFKLARQEGFDNINMDLIIGLPGEGVSEVIATLEQIKELEPDSLTIHTLAMKRGSEASNEHKEKFEEEKRKKEKKDGKEEVDIKKDSNPIEVNHSEDNCMEEIVKEDNIKNINNMLNLCYDAAKEMSLTPYYLYRQKNIAGNFENVGFAKVDKAGIYNILIIEELQTIVGVGVGATTKIVTKEKKIVKKDENRTRQDEECSLTIRRQANTKNIKKYIAEGGRNTSAPSKLFKGVS